MEKVLLVEPNYKNKYPPIGLMKISTYFKNKGDFVEFHKGILPKKQVEEYDKVFITTLFTFDFDMCVETIRYYIAIVGTRNVFVGGIASTIIPEKFLEAVPGIQLLHGQLTSSTLLGYSDCVNIDLLPLDYDILWDISYNYPAANSYFVYSSRGCPRKCSFCAVKTLEPSYYSCNNVKEQILRVDEKFGQKKQLLIMDNNALYSDSLEDTVSELVSLGFGINNNTTKKTSNMRYYLNSLKERLSINKQYVNLLSRIKDEFLNVKISRISNRDKSELDKCIKIINDSNDILFIQYLLKNEHYFIDFFERYHFHNVKRFVDYNQGLDARLFTEEKAKILSQLAIKPCRIAFDDINNEKVYFTALSVAVKNGIYHFSNYLLYNYNDRPTDLWNRLYLNVEFCEQSSNVKSLFSFPMKYASISHTDRSFIGKHWNKKYLKSINVILNVTSGVVAKEKDFFIRAFGKNEKEFLEILSMPYDFIRYRDYFEINRFIDSWTTLYRKLSPSEINILLEILSNADNEKDVAELKYNGSKKINDILLYYGLTKRKVDQNKEYYLRKFNLL